MLIDILLRYRELPRAQRRLHRRAYLGVWAVRLVLWVLPFRTTRRLLAWWGARRDPSAPASVPADVARAVARAARRVPRATCLTQAMAGQLLLAKAGVGSSVRIGVARREHARVQAHAWLECSGRTVLGEHPAGQFEPLLRIEGGSR